MKRLRIKKQAITRPEWLYLVGYAMILFQSFLNSTTYHWIVPSIVKNGIRFAGYVLLMFYAILRRKTNKTLFFLGVIMMLVSLLSLLQSGYSILLDYAFCCIFAVEVDFERIVRVFVGESIALTITTIISALLGIIENYIYYRNSGAVRMSLGFIYPTNFAAHVFFIMAGIAYLEYRRFGWKHVLGYAVVSYVIYLLTNARGPSLMIIILAIVVAAYRYFSEKGISILPRWLMTYSAVICAALTFLMINFYNAQSKIWEFINTITTNRLYYAKRTMNNNAITLLGQFIEQRGDGNGGRLAGEIYTYIDLSFQRILLMYGVLLFVFILIYSIFICKRAYKRRNVIIPLLLFVVSFYSLTAQHFFDFSYNFLLLAGFSRLSCQNQVTRKRKAMADRLALSQQDA